MVQRFCKKQTVAALSESGLMAGDLTDENMNESHDQSDQIEDPAFFGLKNTIFYNEDSLNKNVKCTNDIGIYEIAGKGYLAIIDNEPANSKKIYKEFEKTLSVDTRWTVGLDMTDANSMSVILGITVNENPSKVAYVLKFQIMFCDRIVENPVIFIASDYPKEDILFCLDVPINILQSLNFLLSMAEIKSMILGEEKGILCTVVEIDDIRSTTFFQMTDKLLGKLEG